MLTQDNKVIIIKKRTKFAFLVEFWHSLRETCPHTEFFLAHIFSHLDWIRRDIQSECGKIQTRKNSVFGHFSPNWNFKTSMVIALPAPSIIMTHCIRSNIVNIFHVSHISFFFQSTKGSWNKSEKYEKQGKYWSYCTRRRTIANTYHYLYIFQFFSLLLTLQSLLH